LSAEVNVMRRSNRLPASLLTSIYQDWGNLGKSVFLLPPNVTPTVMVLTRPVSI